MFAIDSNIAPLVESVRVIANSGNKAHDPVVLTLAGNYREHFKMVQVLPRQFPRIWPQGPTRCTADDRWFMLDNNNANNNKKSNNAIVAPASSSNVGDNSTADVPASSSQSQLHC